MIPYTIKSGDTLSALAIEHGTSVKAIMNANPYIDNADIIYAGKVIDIPNDCAAISADDIKSLESARNITATMANSVVDNVILGCDLSDGLACATDISDEGLDFIARHEGFVAQLYNDPAGHCTIGYGHLLHRGNCTAADNAMYPGTISAQQGLELLRQDAQTAVDAVNRYIDVPLNQNQFDALTSFTFNLGVGKLESSDLRRHLNNGEYNAVVAELNRYTYSGTVQFKGLINRRRHEGELFNTPVNSQNTEQESQYQIIVILQQPIGMEENIYSLSLGDKLMSGNELHFTGLQADEEYGLSQSDINLSNPIIIAPMPFDDWLNSEVVTRLNIGESGGFQLLKHEIVDGNTVKLTLLTEPPSFGLFFDGTGNNKTNDNAVYEDAKEPTNIAKLSKLYIVNDYSQSYYADGIGTTSGEDDDLFDLAFASSLDERINGALASVQSFYKQFNHCKVGFIDIFGFSRGAAQACITINIIHYLNQKQPDYWGGCQLMVRFAGLFDTVGSIGWGGDSDNRWFVATGDLPGKPATVTFDVHQNSVCALYHLTALDEQRQNFPLSSIKTSKNHRPENNMHEEDHFGVHADIGGGYSNNPSKINYPSKEAGKKSKKGEANDTYTIPTSFFSTKTVDKGVYAADFKAQLEKEYYKPGIDIKVEEELYLQYVYDIPIQRLRLRASWTRTVDKRLAFVTLEKMHDEAVNHGVPFYPLSDLTRFRFADSKPFYEYVIPNDLPQKIKAAKYQGFGSAAYDALYIDYIHHSHRYGTLAHGPEKKPENAYGHYNREVFYATDKGFYSTDAWLAKTDSSGKIRWFKAPLYYYDNVKGTQYA